MSVISAIISGCTTIGLELANIPAKKSEQFTVATIAYGDLADQTLDIYTPKERPEKLVPAPVLVFFYGGSWDSGQKEQYAFFAKHFVEQGYVVVIPDYPKY